MSEIREFEKMRNPIAIVLIYILFLKNNIIEKKKETARALPRDPKALCTLRQASKFVRRAKQLDIRQLDGLTNSKLRYVLCRALRAPR